MRDFQAFIPRSEFVVAVRRPEIIAQLAFSDFHTVECSNTTSKSRLDWSLIVDGASSAPLNDQLNDAKVSSLVRHWTPFQQNSKACSSADPGDSRMTAVPCKKTSMSLL
jgi:hypothetical protein